MDAHFIAVNNLRLSYHRLHQDVIRAIRTQTGAAVALRAQRRHVLRFLEVAELVRGAICLTAVVGALIINNL